MLHILTIEQLSKGSYPGSELKIEQELPEQEMFKAYIASYMSEGLKIYGYLAIPKVGKPDGGWPIIVFNHGGVDLDKYKVDKQYVRYADYFARAGYIVFKSDYRGHDQSEGEAESAFEAGYAVDVLNAVSSLKRLPDANPEKIGIWGHSMGGGISLKVLEAKPDDFKAASLWAAVSAPYAELTVRWAEQKSKSRPDTSEAEKMRREESRRKIAEELGDPVENIRTYQAVSPGDNLQLVKTPIQLQHVKGDDSIPYQDSEILYDKLKVLGKEVEIYLLEEGDHNFSGSELDDAMKRAIEFFNRYL